MKKCSGTKARGRSVCCVTGNETKDGFERVERMLHCVLIFPEL